MSVSREVELSCDGPRGQRHDCVATLPIFAHTAAGARREARADGWLVSMAGGKDLCPAHRPAPATSSDTPTEEINNA